VIRVLVADDHAVVRTGLERLLETAEGIELVGMAADGDQAVARYAELHPDIVLMDLSMPVADGATATRAITSADPDARIIVLTSFADDRRIIDVLDAGATGYVLKDADPDDLIAAIRSAAAGDAPLDPRAARVLLQNRRSAPSGDLSAREESVLRLVADGLPNKLIARRLGISERTVKAHLTNVFSALGVTDRTQAALWAKEHLPPECPGGAGRRRSGSRGSLRATGTGSTGQPWRDRSPSASPRP
jgi:DNA-binding NarL/FixJ family response regulator